MKLSSYETYKLYLALKMHFTKNNYNYFEYNGKTNATMDSFLARKDKFQFQKLCRKYDKNQIQDFLVANFIKGKSWIGDFLDDECDDTYVAFMKRKQAFTYHFENELIKLFDGVDDPSDIFKTKSSQYPELITRYLNNTLSIETMVVFNVYVKFFDKFDDRIGKDDILWSKIRFLADKVLPFVEYDKSKVKNVLRKMNEKLANK